MSFRATSCVPGLTFGKKFQCLPGASAAVAQVITTAAIDIHLPTSTVQSATGLTLERVGSAMSDGPAGTSQRAGRTARPLGRGNRAAASSMTDCSGACCPASLSGPSPCRDASAVVQELLSSLSEDACLAQKGLAVDPVNLKHPSPAGSGLGSPEPAHRINIFNCRKPEERGARARSCVLLQTKPLIHLQGGSTEPSMEEKHRLLGPSNTPLGRVPDA